MDKIIIECGKFIKGINKVSYASLRKKELAGKSTSGICLSIGGGKIDFVATDGYRLAMYSAKLIKDAVFKRRLYVVPVKAVRELADRISKDENLEIIIQDGGITFNSPSYSSACDLVQGKFPIYHKVIPTSFNIKIKLDKKSLLDGIKSISKDSLRESSKGIKLIPQKNKLIMSTFSSEHYLPEDDKSRTYSIAVETIYNHFGSGDEDFETIPHIYLNNAYIRQALNSVDGDKVIVRFINEYKPVAITSPDPNDGYLALIMPINPEDGIQDWLFTGR